MKRECNHTKFLEQTNKDFHFQVGRPQPHLFDKSGSLGNYKRILTTFELILKIEKNFENAFSNIS